VDYDIILAQRKVDYYMDVRQELIAMRNGLQVAKTTRATKISGDEALFRKLNEKNSPMAAQVLPIRAAEPSYDTIYIDRLRQVLNSSMAASIDITRNGR